MKYTEKNKLQYFKKKEQRKLQNNIFLVRYFYRQSAIKHTKHSENF
jgi:hypothetical protein